MLWRFRGITAAAILNSFSEGSQTVGLFFNGTEGPGTFILNIASDLGSNLRFSFNEILNSVAGVSHTIGGASATPDFTATVTSGSTIQLVISYLAPTAGSGIGFTMSAVPVPAAAALMITAMGGLALVKRFKRA